MEEKILTLLEKNSRLSAGDIAERLGITAAEAAAYLKKFESEGVICGYKTLINWDKTERDFVEALIEVKVAPARGNGFDKIAESIYKFDEVQAVYLMSGGYDLTVLVAGESLKDVAHFVSEKLSAMEAVLSVSTHFMLKKYKDFGVILETNKNKDERLIVSP